MFKISQATEAFALLDQTPEEGIKPLDKALRHLTQRLPAFVAATRAGRADLYPVTAICALRLLHKADVFGLERASLASFWDWLRSDSPLGRRMELDGGFRSMSPIEEAISRVREGEVFDFNLTLYSNGHMGFGADWASDNLSSEGIAQRVFSHIQPDVTFTIHASRLIDALLNQLKGMQE